MQPHAGQFRTFCERMGWGEEVYKATTCLDGGQNEIQKDEDAVLRKVQKLMALSTSSNEHEAQIAMIKSQQLLLKHNIESKYIGTDDEEKICLKRIMKQKKQDAKMQAIARVLETFFVGYVYNRVGDSTYLEILGNAVNVEIADYVASVLKSELDKLWNEARKLAKLKGRIAKNSFFLGIARGYCNKIQALKVQYTNDVTSALMVIEKKLIDAKAMVYPRLSSSKSSAYYCQKSSALGEQMGRSLKINPAVKKAQGNIQALITHSNH